MTAKPEEKWLSGAERRIVMRDAKHGHVDVVKEVAPSTPMDRSLTKSRILDDVRQEVQKTRMCSCSDYENCDYEAK